MRPKTQRAYRRLMTSYKLAFGFRPPYQLLADADFCLEATKQKLDMNKELGVTFQQPTKTFITECSIQELRKKGPEGLNAARMAREFERRRCPHTHKPIGSSECLAQVVGSENKFNYCVLSQNESLRKQLREIPGVPMFYVKSHMIVMEPMTAKSKEIVKKTEQQKLLPTSEETEFLKAAIGGGKNEGEEQQQEQEEEPKKKKKKIKGPNPLSVKKAKKTAPPPPKKRKREEEDHKKKANSKAATDSAPEPTAPAGEGAPKEAPEAEQAQAEKASETLTDAAENKKKRKRRKKTKHDKADPKEVDNNNDEDGKNDEE